MGSFTSKVDVEAISSIESNVVDLIIRLNDQEGPVNAYVKKYLLNALHVYTKHIDRENKKGYISRHKTSRLKDLIAHASAKVKEFPAENKQEPEMFYTLGRDERDIKNHLFEIERYVNTHKLEEAECDNILNLVVAYLQNRSPRLLKCEEEDVVYVLVLKLFLKSSVTTIGSILDSSLNHLGAIVGDFDVVKKDIINTSNVGEVKMKLMEMKTRMETISDVILETMKEIETGSNIHDLNLLNKVRENLSECYSVVEKFSPPVAQNAVTIIKNRVMSTTYTKLDAIAPNSEEVAHLKSLMSGQGVHILNSLQNIDAKNRQVNQFFDYFENIASRIGAVSADTSLKFRDKIRLFDSIKSEVDQIDATNNEIRLQKIEISNSLIGLQTIEASLYLRQMKKTLDHWKMYAAQFPFPKNVGLYQTKIKEVHSLESHLRELPKGNGYVDKRIHKIHEYVHEVLGILEDKAKSNQRVAALVEEIDAIGEELESLSDLSARKKLKGFNKARERLNLIDNLNKRIVARKVKLYSKIHKIEDEIYGIKYPQVIELKSVLNHYEIGSDIPQKHKDEILELSAKLNSLNQEGVIPSEIFLILDYTSSLVNEHLDEILKENTIRNEHSNQLQSIESSLELDKKGANVTFITFKDKLNALKVTARHYGPLIAEIIQLESKILVHQSKSVLAVFWNNLQEIKMNIKALTRPINTDYFKEQLNYLLTLKDRVDDMPEDPDLDLQKQKFLSQLYKVLYLLDERLGRVLENYKHPDGILDLHNRFSDLVTDDQGIPKNSVEFVRVVRCRAESFEERVKYYMGSSDSVDYYVLHENLLRLLEELDRLTCSDQVLVGEMVATMGYIKGLLELLSLNASFD